MQRFILIILLATTSSVHATERGQIVGGSEVISMIVSTFVVIAAILALGWVYSRSKFAVSGSRDIINIVSSKALGTRERLLLIEVADQQLLVGMTASQVQTLHVFDKPVVTATEKLTAPTSFADRLRASIRESRR